MLEPSGIHLGKFFEDVGLGPQQFALLDEDPDDVDAQANRVRTVQNICRHQGAVFREGERPSMGKLESRKVVTICDHLRLLVMGQLKAEVRWESVGIALYRLIQGFVWNAITGGKIRINKHLLRPYGQDERFNWLARLHNSNSIH